MRYLNKEEIKTLTGKSETTVKKFIQRVKNGEVDGVSERVKKEGLTSQQMTRNKQIQTLVNEIYVKSYFNLKGLDDEFKEPVKNNSERVKEPVNPSTVKDLNNSHLIDEINYLRGLLTEKERKNDELTTQLINTNNKLIEITETNQKLLQNQQIIQQTSNTKAIEEDTKKRKWWQIKKG
jgi:hypothetical protein